MYFQHVPFVQPPQNPGIDFPESQRRWSHEQFKKWNEWIKNVHIYKNWFECQHIKYTDILITWHSPAVCSVFCTYNRGATPLHFMAIPAVHFHSNNMTVHVPINVLNIAWKLHFTSNRSKKLLCAHTKKLSSTWAGDNSCRLWAASPSGHWHWA